MVETLPLGLRWRSHSIFILATVAIGQTTDVLLYCIVLPILPFLLHDRMGLDGNDLQIHVSGLLASFSMACLVVSIPAGLLADATKTRQAPYLFGLLLLIISTIMFAVAKGFVFLVVARVLQGLSAAIVNAVGLAMVVDTVGSERLGLALGTIRSCLSIGEFAGPPVGGVLYSKFGYKAVFGVCMTALSLDLLMRILVIEKKTANILFNRVEIAEESIIPGPSQALLVNCPSEEEPLLHDRKETATSFRISDKYKSILIFLRSSRLVVALILTFFQSLIYGVYDATLTSEAAATFNFTSLEAGLLFLLVGFPNVIFAPLVGWSVDKFGTKIVAVVGYGLLTPCLALLRLPAQLDISRSHKIIVQCVVLALQGLCLSITGAPSAVEATQVVDEMAEDEPGCFGENGPYGQLFGLDYFVFSAGLSLGPILGWLLRSQIGYGNMYACLAALSACASVLSFVYLGPGKRNVVSN